MGIPKRTRRLGYSALVVNVLFWLLVGLRWIFLSCRFGAFLHNVLYYIAWSLCRPSANDRRLVSVLLTTFWEGNHAAYEWQRRMYTTRTEVWQQHLRSSFVLKRFIGYFRRKRLQQGGHVVPTLLMVSVNSPGSGCNLSCAHCYASSHHDAILPIESFRKLLVEQEQLGIFSVMVSGGEPFMYDGILGLFQEFPDTMFQVFTNGTLVTEEIVGELAGLGNVALAFSLEGFREDTDQIRGRGVFDKVVRAMEVCKRQGLAFGVTVTVTKNNFSEVVSDRFMSFVELAGCGHANFSTYLATGSTPHEDWEIGPEQVEALDAFKERVRRFYAVFVTVGRNGTAGVTGCFAGREYLHILPSGLAEGCPFVHWADLQFNIRDNPILELTGSPLFQRLREITAQGVPGLVPCRAGRYNAMERFFGEVAIKTGG